MLRHVLCSNDGSTRVLISVDRVPPLSVDEDDHVADESKEDEDTSSYIKDQLLPFAEVDQVESVQHDTEVKVEVGNDDGKLLLDVVRERQGGSTVSPGRVKTEGINAGIPLVIGQGSLSVHRIATDVRNSAQRVSRLAVEVVARAKPVVRNSKELVVNEAHVA